jgi:MtfA peptidase
MKRWWSLRKQGSILTDTLQSQIAAELPVLRHLAPSDHTRLRTLTNWFLRAKTFEGAQGLVVTDRMRVEVALQACLLILNLDIDYYAHWQAIILYPGDFRVDREVMDEDGVVHRWTDTLSGESWDQGPVILSWDTAANTNDMNVVLHEFAHKLDMRDGAANGCPPLRAGMSPQAWSQAFAAAYARFQEALEHNAMLWLDEYAAESPAEFFAVLSEMFFLRPADILRDLPDVYAQLKIFYGQDPMAIPGNISIPV